MSAEPPKKRQKISEYDECKNNSEDDEVVIENCENWVEWNYEQWLKFYDISHGIDSSIFDRNNYIYKLARNRTVGIENDDFECESEEYLYFDIYVCNKLKIDESKLNNLKKELFELGNNNNDWRVGQYIMNIIDPDLFVYKYFDKQKWSNKFKPSFDREIGDALLENIDLIYEININNGDNRLPTAKQEWNKLIENEKKGYFIHNTYQWLATQFNENKQNNNKIEIKSLIHNISPRNKYVNIYNGIEYIFKQMLPLFNKFKSFRNRKKDSFQVIVKSQRYCVNHQSGLTGYWHQEGLNENILIVGLYYFEKDEKLKGGDLKFRNVFSIHDNCQTRLEFIDMEGYDHIDASNYIISPTIKVNQGTAIVFDNKKLVHRIKMLKNKMNDNKKRFMSYLAFFIVDPEKHTNISTKYFPTMKREYYINIIIEYGCNQCPYDIAREICEFAQCGFTLQEAKNMREKHDEIRRNKNTKGRWSGINSSTEIMWYKTGKANQYEHINHYGEIGSEWESATDSEW